MLRSIVQSDARQMICIDCASLFVQLDIGVVFASDVCEERTSCAFCETIAFRKLHVHINNAILCNCFVNNEDLYGMSSEQSRRVDYQLPLLERHHPSRCCRSEETL